MDWAEESFEDIDELVDFLNSLDNHRAIVAKIVFVAEVGLYRVLYPKKYDAP
jgi:hypothetical protein